MHTIYDKLYIEGIVVDSQSLLLQRALFDLLAFAIADDKVCIIDKGLLFRNRKYWQSIDWYSLNRILETNDF